MARAAGLEDEVARAVEQAEIDSLTQCYNRTKMDSVLAAEVRAHRQEEEPFSLIMMDIDFFKRVNDTFGHEAGDEVLAGFAAVWAGLAVFSAGKWARARAVAPAAPSA